MQTVLLSCKESEEEEDQEEVVEEDEEEEGEGEGVEFRVGARVEVHFGVADEEQWWPAIITKLRSDGSVDVAYEDGDKESYKPRSRVRPRHAVECERCASNGRKHRPHSDTCPNNPKRARR